MKALIVDARTDTRRPEILKEVCSRSGCAVTAVELSTDCRPFPEVDIVLAHVGEVQKDSGDDIGTLLAHYGESTWTLCYSGGTPLPAATECTLPFVAVFPKAVDPDAPDDSFLGTIARLLDAAAKDTTVSEDVFRSLALGIDELLEAKLEFLGWCLGGAEASRRSAKVLSAAYSADVEAVGATRPSDIATVRAMRDRFFGE